MSPEQVSGRAAAEASDLYSLAAVTSEALTGRRLVVAETIGEIFSEIVSGAPAPASRYRAGITPAVDRLLLAALAREPERRPEDLVVWADALAAALAAVPSDEEGWPLSRQAA
jgi:serine/threonine-protein kinase